MLRIQVVKSLEPEWLRIVGHRPLGCSLGSCGGEDSRRPPEESLYLRGCLFGAFGSSFSSLEASLGLGAFWELLGPFRGPFGPREGLLGRKALSFVSPCFCWPPLGAVLGPLGCLRRALGRPGALVGCLGRSWKPRGLAWCVFRRALLGGSTRALRAL